MIVSIGIPLDENSSFLKGAALAPSCIREAFRSDSANSFTENGTDLSGSDWFKDLGDLHIPEMPAAFDRIREGILAQITKGNHVISLGGDHSITYPIIQAFAAKYNDLNILHIDAHGDLYHEFEGSKFSHACPFARIMEERLATRLLQVGIRTFTTHQREQAKKFGVETIEMKNWKDGTALEFKGPVYISLDLDALDPAFVPGVSHYEPGGFSTRQILEIIANIRGQVVGADIVELNPNRDINNMTAMVAAKLYKELVSRVHSDQ
jgi:arginase